MEMITNPEYWRAVAQAIDAEDCKASLFINHNQSLGVAREAILRGFLRQHTPEPLRVRTGFIHKPTPEPRFCSSQCDIVVYDPTTAQPDYQIDDTVVVHHWTTKAVVEVKTTLNQKEFGLITDGWSGEYGVHWLAIPVYGFAFDGVSFETFVSYLSDAIKNRVWGLPLCIAVHRKNYLFIRSSYRLQEVAPGRHRAAMYQLAVNFGDATERSGSAAAMLLEWYLGHFRYFNEEGRLCSWFNTLNLPPEDKVRFNNDGTFDSGVTI